MQSSAFGMAEAKGSAGVNEQQQDSSESAERAKKMSEQQEMMKNTMLTQILNKSALARLSNLKVVKPERGQAIENLIIQMARTGEIRSKLTDDDFRKLLDKIAENTSKTTKVKYDRRRAAIDSDEEEEETKGNAGSSSDED